MARQKKPTVLAVIDGSAKKNPKRYPAAKDDGPTEPKGKGTIGTAPTWLDKDQRKCWREIVKTLPAGVGSGSDRIVLANAACLMAWCQANESGTAEWTRNARELRITLGSFGMTPADRAKVVGS